jgi:hypothetical protein
MIAAYACRRAYSARTCGRGDLKFREEGQLYAPMKGHGPSLREFESRRPHICVAQARLRAPAAIREPYPHTHARSLGGVIVHMLNVASTRLGRDRACLR